jgi:hypothetical protein
MRTEDYLETPLLLPLLVGDDLPDEEGQFIGAQSFICLVDAGVLRR